MGKYIVIALLVLLFLPFTLLKPLLSVLSFSIFGIPLWGFLIFGLVIFLIRNKTTQGVLGGIATAAAVRTILKKPEFTFPDDPSVQIAKDPKGIGGGSIYPVGFGIALLQEWEFIASRGGENSQKARISNTNATGNIYFNNDRIGYSVKWVELSLDDLPDKYRKILKL